MDINDKIHTIKGVHVILDGDLAELYGVDTRVVNQAAKRNIERFPERFMFRMNKEEFLNWKSQIVISNKEKMGMRYAPYAFTEQGVATLSGILKSGKAVQVNIHVIRAFVALRKFISANAGVFQRLDRTEIKLIEHDRKFEEVFKAI